MTTKNTSCNSSSAKRYMRMSLALSTQKQASLLKCKRHYPMICNSYLNIYSQYKDKDTVDISHEYLV